MGGCRETIVDAWSWPQGTCGLWRVQASQLQQSVVSLLEHENSLGTLGGLVEDTRSSLRIRLLKNGDLGVPAVAQWVKNLI